MKQSTQQPKNLPNLQKLLITSHPLHLTTRITSDHRSLLHGTHCGKTNPTINFTPSKKNPSPSSSSIRNTRREDWTYSPNTFPILTSPSCPHCQEENLTVSHKFISCPGVLTLRSQLNISPNLSSFQKNNSFHPLLSMNVLTERIVRNGLYSYTYKKKQCILPTWKIKCANVMHVHWCMICITSSLFVLFPVISSYFIVSRSYLYVLRS